MISCPAWCVTDHSTEPHLTPAHQGVRVTIPGVPDPHCSQPSAELALSWVDGDPEPVVMFIAGDVLLSADAAERMGRELLSRAAALRAAKLAEVTL